MAGVAEEAGGDVGQSLGRVAHNHVRRVAGGGGFLRDNRDGSRRWIRPKPSKGRYHRRRLVTAWALMVAFVAIPHLSLNGKPLMLFDIPRSEFTLFGTTFLPTDTFLLMLLLFSIFVGIFLVTAVWGRMWCG